MPMTPGCQPSPAAKTSGRGAIAALDLVDRLRQHPRLDLAPLGVERVELLREAARLDRIVGRQQPRAEIGLRRPGRRH